MGLFTRLWGRRPAPSQAMPQPVSPVLVSLAPAPKVVQPLPVFPDDPLTREVARLWTDFQRIRPNPTWAEFIASLTTKNRELAAAIAKIEHELAAYPPNVVR